MIVSCFGELLAECYILLGEQSIDGHRENMGETTKRPSIYTLTSDQGSYHTYHNMLQVKQASRIHEPAPTIALPNRSTGRPRQIIAFPHVCLPPSLPPV